MSICVVMVGASRPSSEQIIKNIKNNILYFRKKYPIYTFDFIVCTYINESYNDILNFCETNKITSYFLNPIKDSDIPEELDKYMHSDSPDLRSKNRYRMFYSMDYLMNKISNDYRAIIRLRIDSEIKLFNLVDIEPNIYYTIADTETSCSDNIGYASPEVMKKVWDLKNCFVDAFSNETLVYKAITSNSFKIKPFIFKFVLYQNNCDFFDGIYQWSKRNREWAYDGKKYIRNDI